ncbi:MAG: hypothetical protein K6T65_10125 [Peptococcaceae bacterium]|nr:hypothetical protein [Peptococcaceae bacterium]
MSIQKNLRSLKRRIDDEFTNLDYLLKELEESLSKEYIRFRARICAGILDDLYLGVEKIFKDIADKIDMHIPSGKDWHKQLLIQMKTLTNTRPPVINESIYKRIDEYRRFRHVNRNVYGFSYDWDRMNHLVIDAYEMVDELKRVINTWFERMFEIVESLE